ncbi:uncharacterized protein K02A2.6-like [Ruditapes philippinarum]|uniref:uncharacterized protein K02A2.6-like n=1 Tax=Ruditapes philippinarum TaxID=129788 RepID=UPI00295AED0F|nr:uncharacterized protein K02A2.6-like [Ruditapes philippinarum]
MYFKLKPISNPKFIKTRTVAFAVKPKIEVELERLLSECVLEKVTHSEWATPIVPVPKSNGDIRICGDFKVTINPVLEVDQHPLPQIEHIFASLGKGKKFSKIDLKNAYLQLEVDDESKKLLTISTHKGLFRYNRLVFGVASAPAIFQRLIEQIMEDIPNVQVILDDMIITGSDDKEHLEILEQVLKRLDEYGLRVNVEKCKFMEPKVEFCGHEIDADGLHKTDAKIAAIVNAPEIKNVKDLRSFLGLVQYYAKFLENLSTILHPLHQLLQKNARWKWTSDCDKAVQTVKKMITSDLVLVNYDPDLPVILACDASSFGLGAVLSHRLPNGTERPIAFASRSLSSAERNYSQIDKEGLSIVWGIKKFHPYVFGREFLLITDNKPLLSIFGPKKGICSTTAARLQRYALFLSGYRFEIQYKYTKHHGNCDGLSRLPLQYVESHQLDETDIFYSHQFDKLPITSNQVALATQRDLVLSKVYEHVIKGHEISEMSRVYEPYKTRFKELSVYQGCLMWGIRLVIPQTLRQAVLNELHVGHVGIVKMKSLARSYVYWPGIDTDLESIAQSCSGCMMSKSSPPEAPIHPWEYPSRPWSRVHVDFAGPFMGYMFFVLVDAYSKWPIVKIMQTTTTSKTIEILRSIFADLGICDELVSDNGPQFIRDEFQKFLSQNGVKHIRGAPYHPKTNGLAERFVQTFKQALKASKNDSGTLQTKLSRFLMQYRNSEHSTTKETPAKLMFGRTLTTRFDKFRPSLQNRVEKAQSKMVRSTSDRNYLVEDTVMIRDYREKYEKWIPGVIKTQTGPVSYRVEISPGVSWKRHADQIRAADVYPSRLQSQDPNLVVTERPSEIPAEVVKQPTKIPVVPETSANLPVPELRRSSRTIKKPDKLNL